MSGEILLSELADWTRGKANYAIKFNAAPTHLFDVLAPGSRQWHHTGLHRRHGVVTGR
jgi:hypothetical protein